MTEVDTAHGVCVFLYKQKTAYDMRISDWSSDVCSSDLALLMLAACSGGQDEETGPEASPDIGPLQKAERPAPAETPAADAETEAPAKAGPGNAAAAGQPIPPALPGRWPLTAAHCAAKRGPHLTPPTPNRPQLPPFQPPKR